MTVAVAIVMSGTAIPHAAPSDGFPPLAWGEVFVRGVVETWGHSQPRQRLPRLQLPLHMPLQRLQRKSPQILSAPRGHGSPANVPTGARNILIAICHESADNSLAFPFRCTLQNSPSA